MLTIQTANLRAAAGARYLDTLHPGWTERIDSRRLSMGSDENCVLGQLCGSYAMAVRELNLEPLWGTLWEILTDRPTPAVRYGFIAERPWTFNGSAAREVNYERLTAAWRVEITRRREKAKATRRLKRLQAQALQTVRAWMSQAVESAAAQPKWDQLEARLRLLSGESDR